MGGHRLIALDYVGPEVDDNEVRMPVAAKSRQSLVDLKHFFAITTKRKIFTARHDLDTKNEREGDVDLEACKYDMKDSGKESIELDLDPIAEVVEELRERPDHILSDRHHRIEQVNERHVTFQAEESTVVPSDAYASQLCSPLHTNTHPSRAASPFPSATPTQVGESSVPNNDLVKKEFSSTIESNSLCYKLRRHTLPKLNTFLRSFLTPQAIAIFTAFPIALITPLKALFTPVSGSSIPNAPDGQPILAFILDTASFIGAASVPMGLICLGSALARLKIPRGQWHRLPTGAIMGLALAKMIVMPVLGVLIVQGLVRGGVIDPSQKVLRFVCM